MRIHQTILAIAVLAVAVPALAGDDGSRAHHRGGPGGPGMMQGMDDPERMIHGLSRRLDLDEQQQQQLENVALAARPQFDTLRDRARNNHEAIRTLDVEDENYDTRIRELASENGQIATEMTLLGAQLRADIYAILKPDQRQQLREDQDRMQKRFERKRD